MRRLKTILKRLSVWVFPVFLMDGCLNRDPFYKLDSHFTIGTTDAGLSWFLQYSNPSVEDYEINHWSLDDISDYGVTSEAIIGKAPPKFSVLNDPTTVKMRFFIVDRASGTRKFFDDEASRDQALQTVYHRERKNFVFKPSLIVQMQTNRLWPYVHIYYAVCFVLILVSSLRTQPKSEPTNQ